MGLQQQQQERVLRTDGGRTVWEVMLLVQSIIQVYIAAAVAVAVKPTLKIVIAKAVKPVLLANQTSKNDSAV